MLRRLALLSILCFASTSLLWAQGAKRAGGACRQIAAACRNAGFVPGGRSTGNGLQGDCVAPIMQGKPQRPKATKPLPQVDPETVAACKAENPDFGQGKNASAAGGGETAPSAPPPATQPREGAPNIVVVLTDDLSLNLVQYMPHVLAMQKDGVTFANYFVTDSLCCPSRSSIFTGRFPHDTGVFKNAGSDGGYLVFRSRGNESSTYATALYAAGYRTAMLGKYLNGYEPNRHPPGAGWVMWDVAGNGYPEFNYALNQDGKVVHYGRDPADYLTDVISAAAQQFIRQSKGKPFVIEVATFAPHAPYTPAPRDADAFPGLRAPRGPAFNVAPDANAPAWLRAVPPLTPAETDRIDQAFRMRAQAVQAVDKMIGELQAAVAAIGEEKNTYFIFTSDNGYHMGEHRLRPGKMTAFDTDIHVPLVVTGPGVPAGRTVEEIADNIDLTPTFSELSGATPPGTVDGSSLVPLLHGKTPAEWRTVALVEHHGPDRAPDDPDMPARNSGNPTTYEAIRGRTWVYVEYLTGEKEYYDRAADPDELHNIFSSLSAARKVELHAMITAMENCHDAPSCQAAARPPAKP
jgi:arylsulfatase A-like enzyme